MSGKSDQLCRFYSRGKRCRFGDTCRYQHLQTESSEPTLTDQQFVSEDTTQLDTSSRTIVSDKSVKISGKNEGLNSAKDTNLTSSESFSDTSSNKRRKICSFYTKHNRCAFGRNCRFLHQQSSDQDGEPIGDLDTVEEIGDKVQNEHDSNVQISTPHENDQEERDDGRKLCRFYSRRGHCPYKRQCRFEHVRDKEEYVKPPRFEKYKDAKEDINENEKATNSRSKTTKKLCRFFQEGHCRSGEKCKFWHPVDVMDDVRHDFKQSVSLQDEVPEAQPQVFPQEQTTKQPNPRHPKSFPNRAVAKPANRKISIKRDSATQEEIDKLRKTEINQLQKRFPRDRCTVVKEDDDVFECRVIFSPSDPDWPFEVKKFELLFTISSEYPKQMLTVTLPLDQDLPETVRRYVELSVADWIVDKEASLEEAGVYEIVFRPFLRWLDRNLEEYVTEALRQLKREIVARAAGFEFISADRLKSKYKPSEKKEGEEQDEEETSEEEEEFDDQDESDSSQNSDEYNEDTPQRQPIDLDAEKRGTEVSLRHLQLKEGAATLLFEKVRIVIQCGRCKTNTDFTTPAGRINSVSCSKCNNSQLATFRPVLVHQLSSVIGYLDLSNCTIFDLVLQESVAKLGCINCNKESKINGIATGQPLNTWCRHCHQKMMIATEAVYFAQLQPAEVTIDTQRVHQVATKKRVQKDPAIQEGKPLPGYGACKHYKKSYRWFRFPCCGMVYPCDICHEEKGDGHEMVFANRVVCGFCCKEQPYSPDKPCTMCQQMLTRSKSSHWEGGLGCRNRLKMSKNDSQKYSNMNKTVSKHAQKMKDGKKRTKLRHT